MKILLAHNLYRSTAPSGENLVFELERDLLSRRGHQVRSLVRSSDDLTRRGAWGTIQGALATPWNPWSARAIRRVVTDFRPEVVHVHNTFPLVSPAVFGAIGALAPRVLTLHNYRLFCPGAIALRDGKPCTTCLERRSALPALRHGCYRSSRLATLPLAMAVALHRWLGTWERHVDAFIALTSFQRELMVEAGLPSDRVWVKPNFYPGGPTRVAWSLRSEVAVFAGRLTEEKGVAHLVDAWSAWGRCAPTLRIVGDGPLRGALARRAADANARIEFLGQVPAERAHREIASAKLLIVPSIWYEGFPMVLREALAFGTPAAVSDVGPLPGIVEHGVSGVVFRPGDPRSLLEVVRRAWDAPASLERMSLEARRNFEERYSEDANYEALLRIYDAAATVHRERAGS